MEDIVKTESLGRFDIVGGYFWFCLQFALFFVILIFSLQHTLRCFPELNLFKFVSFNILSKKKSGLKDVEVDVKSQKNKKNKKFNYNKNTGAIKINTDQINANKINSNTKVQNNKTEDQNPIVLLTANTTTTDSSRAASPTSFRASINILGNIEDKNKKVTANVTKQNENIILECATSSHKLNKFINRTKDELNQGIADLYNEATHAWEELWGDHLHHGYYPEGKPRNDLQRAQEDMIENTLKFMYDQKIVKTEEINKKNINKKINNKDEDKIEKEDKIEGMNEIRSILDVGCGLGGSSRYLCQKFNCNTVGITLSTYQKNRAKEISASQGLSEKNTFMVCDALKMPFEDNSFDMIWSMESSEHIPDKQSLIKEFCRVCKPGGRIGIVTWCHRNLNNGEKELTPFEQNLLNNLCKYYYLPAWWSLNDYEKCFEDNQLMDVRSEDWTLFVSPFWSDVIRSACSFKGLLCLLKSGMKTFMGLFASVYMIRGYRANLIKFVIITGKKSAI